MPITIDVSPKLMIATPCYDGKVANYYVNSLLQTCYILDHANIQSNILLPTTGAILPKERNDIIEAFMRSDCTHLLCIDSDIGWEPQAPLKFLKYDVDIIAGIYPIRSNLNSVPKYIFTPDFNKNGSIITNEKKLLKMKNVPAGFLMISKNCIKKMRTKLSHLYYENKGIRNFDNAYAFFNFELKDGEFWGEDYVFCNNADKAGIDIWCDPSITFNHAGNVGKLVEILENRPLHDSSLVDYVFS